MRSSGLRTRASYDHFAFCVFGSVCYFYLTVVGEYMKITQITTTSRYAKLTDDTSFFIQCDAQLTDVERNSKWSVAVG